MTQHSSERGESPLQLTLLGDFRLLRSDGSPVMGAGKPLAVLAYLLGARNRRAPRATVCELLWGDSTDSSKRASLRQALFVLRNAIGSAEIHTEGEWIEVSESIRTDVDRFLHAIERRDYSTAVGAYGGDFIPAFASPGAREFERWADTERLRLRNTFLTAAGQHLQALTARGDLAAALPLSRRLVEMSPLDDEWWRQRFDLLALAGQTGTLLMETASLRAQRAEEEQPLDAQFERDIDRLVGASSSRTSETAQEQVAPHSSIPSTPEFQGRTEAFGALLAAWGRAKAGQPQRFLVIGQAGMGKSRLLREFERRVSRRRVRVVAVEAHQRERDDAYALLSDIITALAALPGAAGLAPSSATVLAALVPGFMGAKTGAIDTAGGESELPLQRARALVDLIGAIAEENPLVLLLDDLHWADDASVKVVELALARLAKIPLLLVATSRHAAPDLGCGDARIELRPLEESETQALLASIAELPAEGGLALVEPVHRAAGGSPLGVLRILRAAIAAGGLWLNGRQWIVTSSELLLQSCHEAKTSAGRLRDLGNLEQELLGVLAVANSAVEEGLLVSLFEDRTHALAALARIERQGLIGRDAKHRWAIAHALIADDARALLDDAKRRAIAARIGKALLPHARDTAAVRHAVRLLLEGNEPETAEAGAVGWYTSQVPAPLTPQQFVDVTLGALDVPELRARILRRLNRKRAWWRHPTFVSAASVFVTGLLVAWYLLQPSQLVLISAIDPSMLHDDAVPFEVPIDVEVRNRLGWRTSLRDGDTLRASTDMGATMRGRVSAVVSNGRATFDSLYPPLMQASLSRATMRITASRLPPITLSGSLQRTGVQIVDFLVNGHLVRDSVGTIRVRPGEAITGTVRFRYTTRSRSLLYMLAQTTTWGRPEQDTLTVRSLLAGVVDARMSVGLDLRAPETPGDYWILWTQEAEPSGVWLLSGTNWRCRRPRWNDGNDLASFPDSTLAAAVRRGGLSVEFTYCEDREWREARPLPVAGIRVEVREPGSEAN